MNELILKVESIIFCSPKTLSTQEIKNCIEEDEKKKISENKINEIIEVLINKYDNEKFSFEIIKLAKGYFGRRKNVWTIAKNAVEKAMQYSYRDRKTKKRNFRSLWITRINAACRLYGMSYSQFMGKIKLKKIDLNRKVLADLAMNNPEAFKAIVDKLK